MTSPGPWTDFRHIDEVIPIDNSDLRRLCKVRDDLKRDRRLIRFGIAIPRTLFDVVQDEALVQSPDMSNRTLTMSTKPALDTDAIVRTPYVRMRE